MITNLSSTSVMDCPVKEMDGLPNSRDLIKREGERGRGGQVDKERPKVIKEKQRQMTTTNEPQWRKTVGWVGGRVDYQDLN